MAKSKQDGSDEVKAADLREGGNAPQFLDEKDIEIERLRKELADAKASPAPPPGGRYTCSIKDGPTVTVETQAGERPEDAFLRACAIHSTPHRVSVEAVDEKAPLGVHLPNGTIRPFAA